MTTKNIILTVGVTILTVVCMFSLLTVLERINKEYYYFCLNTIEISNARLGVIRQNGGSMKYSNGEIFTFPVCDSESTVYRFEKLIK